MQFLAKNKALASVDHSRLRTRCHFRWFLLGSYFLFGIAVSLVSTSIAAADPNMFLNQTEIDAIKLKINAGEAPWTGALNTVLDRAQVALNTPLQSVTYQGVVSGNIQWHQDDDHPAAIIMSDSVRTLGLAYAFTGESQYAEKALDFIRTWTLDPVTRMRPTPPGKSIQISVTMPALFYGADLISNYEGWNPTEKAGFQDWTQAIAADVRANGQGNNNFSNWRTVMLASAGAFLHDESLLTYAADEWRRLVPIQIQNSGSAWAGRMSQEYTRDDGLHYSTFAINAMMQTAEIMDNRGVNLYDYVHEFETNGAPNGTYASLKLALDYITPYAIAPETWPYSQVTEIAQRHSMAMYELAYSYYQDQLFLDAINRWERPMYENRILGITTLTHANTFELDVSSVANGDFDFDNDVDGSDLLRWQRGGLSLSSLAAWEANFGASLPIGTATSVPEPATGLISAVCCGIYAMRRRRTRDASPV